MLKTRTGRVPRPFIFVTVLCLFYSLAVVVVRGSPLALVTPGAQFKPDQIAYSYSDEGYDGQFVYYIARDPGHAALYLDVPAYRFQRILLPALGFVLAFGQESLLVWVLLAVNLVSLAAGTWLVERMLAERRLSRIYALGYGLTMGAFGAARLSLPEPLAYALVLGGIYFARDERWRSSAVLFMLAALAKETTLVFPAVYGAYLLYHRRWILAAGFGFVVLGPFVAWQITLYQRLGAFGVGSGGALATSFEVIPFAGIIRIFTEGGLQVALVLALVLIPFVLVPTLWGLLQGWRDFRNQHWDLSTTLLVANAGLMLFVPFSTYREILGILRFIIGLQIAVILYAANRRSKRALLNSTIWCVTVLFVIMSDFGGI